MSADFKAGYAILSIPTSNTYEVYLETRKGVQSNIIVVGPPT